MFEQSRPHRARQAVASAGESNVSTKAPVLARNLLSRAYIFDRGLKSSKFLTAIDSSCDDANRPALGKKIQSAVAKRKLSAMRNSAKRIAQRRHLLLLMLADELEGEMKILRLGE